MKAIVLGAGGQLGVELEAEFSRRGHSTLGFNRRQLDITVAEAVEAAIARHEPEWVLNSAAYNYVDLAEKEHEKAMAVNGFAVRNIALACQRHGAKLLHYSTDHVFSGHKGAPYTEEDCPAPPSAYAVSKLAGEGYALAYCEDALVLRVAGVFGPAGQHTPRGNFPELVLKKARAGEELRVVDDVSSTPTYAVPLAARSLDLLEQGGSGVFHIAGGETITWYSYALKVLQAAGLEAKVSPTNHREFVTPARRPRHSSLSNAKMEAAGLAPMPGLDESLKDYLKRRDS